MRSAAVESPGATETLIGRGIEHVGIGGVHDEIDRPRVLVDGEHVLALATSQDHKARDDGDTGPNTGGMGAYSPAPVVDAAMHQRIMDEVIWPTVRGMAADGKPVS